MNSPYFSSGKISHLGVAAVPGSELGDLGLDSNPDTSEDGETSVQHIPLVLEYNDAEDWYWHYGQELLYPQFCPRDRQGVDSPVDWLTLHRFVSSYAWIEGRWRFILDKPCWTLHSDVVDRVVMLYQGRKSYEEHRGSGEVKSHVEFLDLLERVAKDVEALLSHCEIKTAAAAEENKPYLYVRHSVGEHVRNWIPTLLHRVLSWEGLQPPDCPVMDAARSAASYSHTMFPLGGSRAHDDIVRSTLFCDGEGTAGGDADESHL